MTRCTFFVIEAAGAVHDWVADLRARRVPFLLFGLTPVLHRPDSRRRRFRDPESIDALFLAIEEVEGLVVETASLWLPNFAVEAAFGRRLADEVGVARGEVLRIRSPLLQEALRFSRDAIDAETFVEATRARLEETAPRTRVVRHSAAESRAFREWSRAQFQEAHANYRRQRVDGRGVLRWRDERGRAHEG
jgi:hypothetical protein